MKKEILIGILAIAAIVIAGCTQVRESTSRPQVSKESYGQDLTDCEVFSVEFGDGQATCVNNGYSLCVEQKRPKVVTYYDSTDGSCSGAIQVNVETLIPQSCGREGPGAGCGSGNDPGKAEPYRGDLSESYQEAEYVTCCK